MPPLLDPAIRVRAPRRHRRLLALRAHF
ncbi:hypothetical protein COLE_02289 [Cutaneotrichosporon oleaginosum]|nr:hypothetical protein COLE_02289 [Cutaneotrichosporon oleaginosum]